jgi:hypothetical protein
MLEAYMDRSGFLRGLAVTLVLGFTFTAPLVAADAAPKPSGNWHIVFDNWSENDGELVLRVASATGDPVDVTTRIPKGMTENNVADLVAGSLKAALGGGYRINVDDGEKIEIKTKGKTAKFVLSMVSSSATGLNVKIKRK